MSSADRDGGAQPADGPRRISRAALAPLLVTAVYGAIVLAGAAYHEPWRDEVVPLSIARHARSLTELGDPLQFEGHPILWYLVLWCGYNVIGNTWVLKAASLASAVGAMFLLNRSPLPWWFRWLFTFSFFPLYQYSVVSRGYSLEMLLLFAFCTLYRRRYERPMTLALVLAALANAEPAGFIISVAAVAMLAVESMTGQSDWRAVASRRSSQVAVVVYLGGVALAAAVALPSSGHPLSAFQQSRLGDVAAGVSRAIAQPGAHAARFFGLPLTSLWLWAYCAYLAPLLPVFCFAVVALVGIETLFNVVYGPAAPWHTGNVVLALVAVAWLAASEASTARPLPARLARARVWLGAVLAAGAIFVLADEAVMAVDNLKLDLQYDYSANRSFAELLHGDPALAGAVVMGEPDMPLWSLPYYADNRIYLVREQVFRPWGMFAPGRARTNDIVTLLSAARRVRDDCGCPVMITLGWRLDTPGRFANFPGTYAEEWFDITAAGRDEFLAATRLVARLGPTITDENYDVYVLR